MVHRHRLGLGNAVDIDKLREDELDLVLVQELGGLVEIHSRRTFAKVKAESGPQA